MYCPTPDLPIPSSPANDLKNMYWLYIRVVGWSVDVTLVTILMLRWPLKMLKLSHLSLRRRHIWDISGTFLVHIYDISGTYLGHIWNISGTYLIHILEIS